MKKILITEDDALMAEIYSSSFERDGYSVEVVSDGISAVQRVTQDPPDLVLLDLMLPQLNGVEVLKRIRGLEATRRIPVVVLSNSYADALGLEAARAGATRLLSKNAVTPRRLLAEVRSLL